MTGCTKSVQEPRNSNNFSVMFCDFSGQVTQEECETILSLVPARRGETSPDLLQGSRL